jgi:hypothetical protein
MLLGGKEEESGVVASNEIIGTMSNMHVRL